MENKTRIIKLLAANRRTIADMKLIGSVRDAIFDLAIECARRWMVKVQANEYTRWITIKLTGPIKDLRAEVVITQWTCPVPQPWIEANMGGNKLVKFHNWHKHLYQYRDRELWLQICQDCKEASIAVQLRDDKGREIDG